jgi:hypothetical protein
LKRRSHKAGLKYLSLASPIYAIESYNAAIGPLSSKSKDFSPRMDVVAGMLVSRDFKEIRRKSFRFFMSGADHAFQDPMGRWIATGTLAE